MDTRDLSISELVVKTAIFKRHPDLVNVRALAWSGGLEVPTSKLVGVAVVPAASFDGWRHIAVRDDEFRDAVRGWLREHAPMRHNSSDPDAVLVLTVLQ